VSCPSETDCEAVGWTGSAVDGTGLIERWNGRRWLIRSDSFGTPFSAVSCSSANACSAVGWLEPGDATDPFVYRWDGASWSFQDDASLEYHGVVPDAGYGSVSCRTRTACTAVGGSWGPLEVGEIAEGWDGTAWSREVMPGTLGVLYSVSCPTSGVCFAVGGEGLAQIETYRALAPSKYFVQMKPNTFDGSGNVTSSPAGINCGSKGTHCTAPFPNGTQVTLTEHADRGSTFEGWGLMSIDGTSECDDVPYTATCTFTVPLDEPIAITRVGAGFKPRT
jgi:hypothetical protein